MFLKNDLGQKAQTAENSVLEMTKGSGAYQDARKANAVGNLLGFGIPESANKVLKGQPQQQTNSSSLPEYLVPKSEETAPIEQPSMIERYQQQTSSKAGL